MVQPDRNPAPQPDRGSRVNPTESSKSLPAVHVRMILESAMDGIISVNARQEIILFNPAAEAIFGWSSDEVLGRPIDLLIPLRYQSQHRSYVEQFGKDLIQSRRMGVQRTVMALHRSGVEFPIEASISHTILDDEQVYTVILRDVTDAVRRRQQIEQQSQMLDQVSDAVNVVDPTGKITYWNHGATNLFGWSAQEAIGQNASELFFRDSSELWQTILRETNKRGSWTGELTKMTRTGKSVIVDHRRTILKEGNELKGYLCIDIDITDRKKHERISLRSQRLESIGTLAGGIAHDLNNVLTPILMGAKLLSSDRAPANRQGLLDTMVASARRGAALIQQLLAFAGGIQGERQPIHIGQLIHETRGLLEHTLPKSIQIITKIASNVPPVMGDATELSQILMNLCINARDAMPQGGELTIEAEPIHFSRNTPLPHPDAHDGTYLHLKVADTGCGMTSEVLDRIFDPFFTTKDLGKGTGLGLATVQGIVKSHGGFILVYSEPGDGSSFSIYLPTATTLPTSTSETSSKEPIRTGDGRWILLVDDEAIILQMTEAVLEANGYHVITASDGPSAVQKFSEDPGKISAVLLDMMMPGMDGFQTLEKLLQIDPNVKVIACSGLGTAQRERKAVAAGAKIFLSKPHSDDQLLDALLRLSQVEAAP
ncbi:PAS domain S-box protein [Schlesneria sp. T3-172]|uniref:PAS domain S-box protein n=1 Tax=Schlesneria sphaerica TaxID=3373610 RepID=UPI0037CB5285